jgi:hypothetical protein
MSQGPEYGDASACLKITYPGDPARPSEHLFKMRTPTDGQTVAKIPNDARATSPEKAAGVSVRPGRDLTGRHGR